MDVKIRYQGKNVHRYRGNPLERAFAKEWQKQCEIGGNLEYLLSGKANQRLPVNDTEQIAANTVIQWLGSPVGQSFLCAILATKEAEHFIEYLVDDPVIKEKLSKLL